MYIAHGIKARILTTQSEESAIGHVKQFVGMNRESCESYMSQGGYIPCHGDDLDEQEYPELYKCLEAHTPQGMVVAVPDYSMKVVEKDLFDELSPSEIIITDYLDGTLQPPWLNKE